MVAGGTRLRAPHSSLGLFGSGSLACCVLFHLLLEVGCPENAEDAFTVDEELLVPISSEILFSLFCVSSSMKSNFQGGATRGALSQRAGVSYVA
mgnify:CR=1 FL=1